jgi:AcrR family transcriptional regulator
MRARTKARDFAPKKLPAQDRSRDTFDALVDACTWLLPRAGFAKTTTNRIAERAGVNIASLYEYFPNKDAIVAQVADRLVDRVLARLEAGAARLPADPKRVARAWIELIYQTVAAEKALVAVFLQEVPYTSQLGAVRGLAPRLLAFSLELRRTAGDLVRADFSSASLRLLINLVSSTILQLVLEPPSDVSRRELLDELARWMEDRVQQ